MCLSAPKTSSRGPTVSPLNRTKKVHLLITVKIKTPPKILQHQLCKAVPKQSEHYFFLKHLKDRKRLGNCVRYGLRLDPAPTKVNMSLLSFKWGHEPAAYLQYAQCFSTVLRDGAEQFPGTSGRTVQLAHCRLCAHAQVLGRNSCQGPLHTVQL